MLRLIKVQDTNNVLTIGWGMRSENTAADRFQNSAVNGSEPNSTIQLKVMCLSYHALPGCSCLEQCKNESVRENWKDVSVIELLERIFSCAKKKKKKSTYCLFWGACC